MKKLIYLFACTALFAACSSDDSNSNGIVTPEPIPEPSVPVETKKSMFISGYDVDLKKDFFYLLDTNTGEIQILDNSIVANIEGVEFYNVTYNDDEKKLYGLTNHTLSTLDVVNKALVVKELNPSFTEETNGCELDKEGRVLTFINNYSGLGNYGSLYAINKETGVPRIENGSQKLNQLLRDKDNFIFRFFLNNSKTELIAHYRAKVGEKIKYSLLFLNPYDLEDFDDNFKEKTIELPEVLGDDEGGYGFFMDTADTIYVLYERDDKELLATFDIKTKKFTDVFEFESGFIGDLAYDKTTNNIIYLVGEDKDDSFAYKEVVTRNLGNLKVSKTVVLSKHLELEIATSILVDRM